MPKIKYNDRANPKDLRSVTLRTTLVNCTDAELREVVDYCELRRRELAKQKLKRGRGGFGNLAER